MWLRGHARSSKLVPFESVGVVSYQACSQRGAKGAVGQCPPKLKLCPALNCGRPTTNKTKCRPIVLTSTPYSYTRSAVFTFGQTVNPFQMQCLLTSYPLGLFSPPVKNSLNCLASLTKCGTGRFNDI